MNALENTLNTSVTENGAKGYKTTKNSLLDMNFKVSSYRNKTNSEILEDFKKALSEDFENTILWLFYSRDIREGLGERRLFRTIMAYLGANYPDLVLELLSLIPEYGRWDDVIDLLTYPNVVDSNVIEEIINLIKHQLILDAENIRRGNSISLLSKWLPSENASSKSTKQLAKFIREKLGYSSKQYRKILSKFRSYLKIVEKDMSSNNWNNINYENVPSKANLLYSNAFMKHDYKRRMQFLQNVNEGSKKINSSTNYPYEILSKYTSKCKVDDTLEELWKALPDVSIAENTLVVADGSGSMYTRISNTSNANAIDVANSLAIYCAEHAKGPYQNKYITFSKSPQYVDFSNKSTLYGKMLYAREFNEVANTNIEAVFDLILETAISNNLSQEELPRNVLIISDMEFDVARTRTYNENKLFNIINNKYNDNGYQMPRLIFWNVCSRTNTIPLKENENGLVLVSGFSQNILNMVMSNKLDPYEVLIETLNSDRYKPVKDALKTVFTYV